MDELEGLVAVEVELASGSTTLSSLPRYAQDQTLLSLHEVEPILPLHLLRCQRATGWCGKRKAVAFPIQRMAR